jgi:hypothetical protein
MIRVEFADLPLETEQRNLLAAMVEAERAVATTDRQPFLLIKVSEGAFLNHPGLRGRRCISGRP